MAAHDAEDAYAATVAPVSSMGVDATMAAGSSSERDRAAGLEGNLGALPIIDVETYVLDKEIARGGMGRIVAAEDQRLGRRVALKVLLEPAGDQLGRFQREALITARLQHPGIVPVYEAGRWPSGEPFFAMKLVAGLPLDRVIAETRSLDERLALLPRIAAATDAIAYAHNQRVVHRDLKPANVLIGDFGETVVIDWGLAKDLDAGDSLDSAARAPRKVMVPLTVPPEAERGTPPTPPRSSYSTASSTLTIAGAVMGTPAYMAPEQARGEAVDQRADVFALGAMLYHLLAGAPPYNAKTATDVIAAAALGRVVPLVEREARAPADLVAIVQRAMAQDPARRYAHAGELADELRRFLTGQLVSAHRYTRSQRLARFVKKHRAAVTIATIATVAFAVGGTVAVTSIVRERDRAQHESTVASARRDAAESLIDGMLVGMQSRLRGIGRLDLLSSLGQDIERYYLTLGALRATSIDGLDRMAKAVDLIGSAERDQGDVEGATTTFQRAFDELAAAVGTDRTPRTFEHRVMLARLQFERGTCLQQKARHAEAAAAYQDARARFVDLLAEQARDGRLLLYASEAQDRIGDLLRNDGKLDAAFTEYDLGRVQRETAKSVATGRPLAEVAALSTSHLKLGSIFQARADTAAALSAYRTSLRLRDTLLDMDPDNMDYQSRVLEVEDTIAELQRELGDSKSAVATYQEALPLMVALTRRDPNNQTWGRMYGNLLADLGFALLDTGAFADAIAQLDAATDAQQAMLAKDPSSAAWLMDLSRTHLRAGDALVAIGKYPEAVARYDLAHAIRSKLATSDPKSAPYARALAWSEHKLGRVYALRADRKGALAYFETALPLRTRNVERAPGHPGYTNELASTEIAIGELLASGPGADLARAETLISRGLERARTLAAADPASNEWRETVVDGLIARAEVAHAATHPDSERDALVEAASVAEQAEQRAAQPAQWACYLADVQARFAALATDTGDHATAAAAWARARALLEPLDRAGLLPAPRRSLLARARAFK